MTELNKIFISYSHNDANWLERVRIHLIDQGRQEAIDVWDDSRIQPGADWRNELESALRSTKVAILLISQDFIASDFIDKYELPALLEAAEQNGVTILPLLISPSSFEKRKDLSKFQSINPPTRTLLDLTKADQERYLVKLDDAVSQAFTNSLDGQSRTIKSGQQKFVNFPFRRNRFFTGRNDVLHKLYTNFKEGERIQALVGLGGIGKTQTAVEYAYHYNKDYSRVLWVGANTREALISDFFKLATILNSKEKGVNDQREAVIAVIHWLECNADWLLILDNADELKDIESFIPSGANGHILLTTRAENAGAIALYNGLKKLTPDESMLFLLKKTSYLGKNSSLYSISEEIRNDAEALSKELDGLPLALDQAAAFMNQTGRSFKAYIKLFETERRRLLEERGELTIDHDSVMVTFSLAFKKLATTSLAGADILRVCAFLNAELIPEELFFKGARELGDTVCALAEDRLGLIKAIGEVSRYSLIEIDRENQTLSIHRLVQIVLREEMVGESIDRLWAERTIRAMGSIFPTADFKNWELCSRLIVHINPITSIIDQYAFEFIDALTLLHEAGQYLKQRAQFEEAEPLYRRIIEIGKRSLELDHPSVSTWLNHLATLLEDTNRISEAEILFRQAIEIGERSLGSEHPDVASRINNLALLLHTTNRMIEAEFLFRQVIDIGERTLGPDHPIVASRLNNLARLLHASNRIAEAEPLFRRAIEINEKHLEPNHPDLSYSLNNLARLLHATNRMEESEILFRRAIAISETSLGQDHPSIAIWLNNLGMLLRDTDRMAEAENLLRRALEISEKSYGADHPTVAIRVNNLALLFHDTNRMADAEPLFLRALEINEKAYGPDHPNVGINLNNLAMLLFSTKRIAQAEIHYKRAIDIGERSLGPDHFRLAAWINNLGKLYHSMNQMQEAEPLFRRSLCIFEMSLGASHPHTIKSRENMVKFLRDLDRAEEAEKLDSLKTTIE